MPVANNRLLTDDTGLALVNAIERIAPLQIAPLVVSIPTGQWSGSGNDYYISVSASNVTANSILVPNYDNESAAYLKGPVWCVPAAGSFTIHTSVVPSGAVNIMVQFPGTMGEANYQVLADVYSKSQTYSKTEAVAKADIVNNLTSTSTTAPLSAAQGKALNDAIKNTGVGITKGAKIESFMSQCRVQSNVVLISGYMNISATLQTNDVIATLTGISAAADNIRIPFFLNDGSGKMFFGKIAQNGNQILVDSALNNTASGQYYVFNFSFPATQS